MLKAADWIKTSRVSGHRRYNRLNMPAQLTRVRIIDALRDLPADAGVDEAIERLVFLARIEAGLQQLDRGEGVSHEEVKGRFTP